MSTRPDAEAAGEFAPMPGATPLLTSVAVDITAPDAVGDDALGAGQLGSGPVAPGLLVADRAESVPAVEAGPPVAGATPAAAAVGGEGAPTHRRGHRARRRHRLWPWLILGVVVILAAGGLIAVQRVTHPLASPQLTSSLPASIPVPGPAPVLPWPTVGQGAVAIPAIGYAAQSGPEAPLPIASLTKMANAVVILRDHPLPVGAQGPTITVTQADVGEYDYDINNDESNIPIQLGEKLTELQMLEALMNQSANDIAFSLAMWDAGSIPAFVAKMNALAVSLGADHTHYADASGYDPQSVSTAADTLRIAAAGMRIPAFAKVVGLSTVSLPLVGTVHNIVTEIGSNGVVGVKSGYTSQAGGCMVLAGYRVIGGRSILVLASALAQHVPAPVAPNPNPTPAAGAHSTTPTSSPSTTTTTAPTDGLEVEYPLRYAGPIVETLLDASKAAVVQVPLVASGQVLASADAEWDGTSHQVGAVASTGASMIGWPGQKVASVVRFGAVRPGAKAGSLAGHALYALGQQVESVPLTITRTLPEPSWSWRLVHG